MLPNKIRVAQDGDGFWTCRWAVSNSPQYVSEDIVVDLVSALSSILSNRETVGAGASIFQCTTAEVEAARRAIAKATA